MKGIIIGLLCLNVGLATYFVRAIARRPVAASVSDPARVTSETAPMKAVATRARATRSARSSQDAFN